MAEINRILQYLGATNIRNLDASTLPPTNEDEFNIVMKTFTYDSPIQITWDMYQAAKEPTYRFWGLKAIRIWRDERLKGTDWIMTTDNTDSLLNKEEWYAYRQTLRDLPKTIQTFIFKGFPRRLDFEAMNLPQAPPIKRKPIQTNTETITTEPSTETTTQ